MTNFVKLDRRITLEDVGKKVKLRSGLRSGLIYNIVEVYDSCVVIQHSDKLLYTDINGINKDFYNILDITYIECSEPCNISEEIIGSDSVNFTDDDHDTLWNGQKFTKEPVKDLELLMVTVHRGTKYLEIEKEGYLITVKKI